MLLLLLFIQCKISMYLGLVRTVRCFVTPDLETQRNGIGASRHSNVCPILTDLDSKVNLVLVLLLARQYGPDDVSG